MASQINVSKYPIPQNTATFMMRLVCSEAEALAISDMASEVLDPQSTAVTISEIATPVPQWNVTHWAVEIFFETAPNEAQMRALASQVVGAEVASLASFSVVEQADWVSRSLDGLSCVRVGRFLLHGSHDRGRVQPHEIALEIEAALAFGTGHHGTTRGCLMLLGAILKTRRPRKVLDVGTGTGVLALAAARMLKRPISAGDIDPVCVTAARANAILNGARPWLRPVIAKGISNAELNRLKNFDLVFANILAKPLRLLAPDIAKVTTSNGQLVLSGLLAGDVAGVLSAYRAQQFYLVQRLQVEGWYSLLLQKKSTIGRGYDYL